MACRKGLGKSSCEAFVSMASVTNAAKQTKESICSK